jgi:secondary thiamine-phosphate synthase enzyme
MRQASHVLTIASRSRGLIELTAEVRDFVRIAGVREGLLTVFCRHTSASLLIQENAGPDVHHELDAFFARLAPDGDPGWRRCNEGPDDMSAHIRSAQTQTSIGIPVVDGRLVLGT